MIKERVQELQQAFLVVRRHYKLAFKPERMWGGKITQSVIAWQQFEALLKEFFESTTGGALEKKTILRRGDHVFNVVERSGESDRCPSENIEALE